MYVYSIIKDMHTVTYSHHLIVPDDLDGHVLLSLEGVPSPHHITEHS